MALIDQRKRMSKPALMHRLHNLPRPLPAKPTHQAPGRFQRHKMLMCVATVPACAALGRRYKSARLVVAHLLRADIGSLGKIFCT
jgi:hypothetical protein